MRRITLSMDDKLADEFDAWAERKGYQQRSEAFRDLLRERLEREQKSTGEGDCVGSLTYVFNHHERRLAERLTKQQHEHHDVCHSTLHFHLDHDNCLEVVLLKGSLKDVRDFAEATVAERGVRHGNIHLVPVKPAHRHSHVLITGHKHSHFTPRT